MPLGRKACLLCWPNWGGNRAAVLYTLIATGWLNDANPRAWLAERSRAISAAHQLPI